MQELTAKQICLGYAVQLKNGCDRIDCHNHMCKSCKQFSLTFENEQAFAAKIRELMEGHHVCDNLCKGLSPIVFQPELGKKARDFDDLVDSLKRGKEVDIDQAKATIHEALSNPNVFIYIQKSNSGKLSRDNVAVSDEWAAELAQVVRRNWALFAQFRAEFLEMVTCFLKQSTTTFHQLRGLMLVFCFGPYLCGGEVSQAAHALAKHILDLENVADATMKHVLGSFPNVVSLILHVFQNNLSVFAMEYMPVVEHQEVKQSDLRGDVPMILARAIQWLRGVVSMSEIALPSFEFGNGPLSSCLDTQYEVIEFLKAREGKPNYLSVPAVLTLGAKGAMLRFFNEVQQDQRARESITLRALRAPISRRDLQLFIEVSREDIVQDTIRELTRTSEENLLKKLMVVFKGEQGVDAGGVSREFFYLLCNAIFSPDYGMFEKVSGDKYWFNSANLEAPLYFSLLGTVVALAFYNFVILPIRFPKVLYKKLRGKKPTLKDLEELDEGLVEGFRALMKVREDGGNVEDAGLTFTREVHRFDSTEVIPLKPGGEEIPVTNENLDEYINLYCDDMMNKSVEKQFTSFEKGYMKLCDQPIFNIFEADELDILVSGVEVLDWSELQKYAKYSDGYTANSQAVKWFWEIFNELTLEQKKKFLRFSTGSDRTPIGGLKDVQLVIQRMGDPTKLPVSHTCFNIFGLPEYSSQEIMREKLMIAIENNEGFGLI